MNTKNKKGYALMLAILLVIILAISGLGLYYSIEHLAKEIRIKEVNRIKGYYCAVAGLRYAAILLRDSAGNLGFTDPDNIEDFSTDDLHKGDSQYNTFIAFCDDINTSQARLAITIIEENPLGGSYKVKATYKY